MWHLEKAGTVLNTTEQILQVPDSCLMNEGKDKPPRPSATVPAARCPLQGASSQWARQPWYTWRPEATFGDLVLAPPLGSVAPSWGLGCLLLFNL